MRCLRHSRAGKIHRLDADTLDKIAGTKQSDTVKIFNLLKALHELVEQESQHQPYLINIGTRRRKLPAHSRTAEDDTGHSSELERLVTELKDAEKKRDETELTPEAFAVYWFLKREGVSEAQKVAQSAAKTFEEFPHWQTSGHQEQEVRKSLYKALIEAGVEAVVDLAQGVMKMLRSASS
jgi:type I restriction enzyme R subunit